MALGKSALVKSVFAVTQLVEKLKEFNLPIYIAFTGYTKAFDVVNRNKILALIGLLQHII
jgi:hypothetical protein